MRTVLDPLPLAGDKKARMRAIIDEVGREKAIELVMQAYNTELVTNWLSHIEGGKRTQLSGDRSKDHLGAALARVQTVCQLTG